MHFETNIVENYFEIILPYAFHSPLSQCLLHSKLIKHLDVFLIEKLISSATLFMTLTGKELAMMELEPLRQKMRK